MKLNNKKFSILSSIYICASCAPFLFGVIVLETLISCVIPTLQIAFFAQFVNSAKNVYDGNSNLGDLYLNILYVMLILGYQKIIPIIMNYIWFKLQSKVSLNYGILMIKKNASLKYSYLENLEYVELINRVVDKGEVKITQMLHTITGTICLIAQTLSIVIFIFIQSGIVALCIILLSLPMLLLATKAGENTYVTAKEAAQFRRRYEYFSSLLSDRHSSNERSLFGYQKYINSKWMQQFDEYRKADHKNWIRNNILTESGSIVTTLFSIVMIIFLLFPLMDGITSIGLFTSMVMYILNFVEVMSFSFKDLVGEFTNLQAYTKELTVFWGFEQEDGALDLPSHEVEFNTLEFRNVSFKYPADRQYIISKLNLFIEKGKHYAFVGANGAGKTTIVKLLTGLYRNYEGEILLNGKELRDYPLSQLKYLSSIVYQDFATYEISIKDNISIGDISNCSHNSIESAIELAQLDTVINNLPNGLDSMLGHIHDHGQDLSGGQWQRVAIARALVKKHALLILDEPTSALDPLMETSIYEDFARTCQGRTTIFISHRLGSTKLADKIFVLSNGRIAEEGTHLSLMEQKGIYYEMFNTQRRWYE